MSRRASQMIASRGHGITLGLIRERWQYLPLAITGVYLIVLAAQFPAIIRTIHQNADAAAPSNSRS